MVELDFSTKEGKARGTELAKEIFADFDKVETTFTEYGTMEVFLDDIFDFSFRGNEIVQLKRAIVLRELKKLDRLTNSKFCEE